jgi:hypothetical protein
MKKTLLAISAILLMTLMAVAQVVFPVYATTTPIELRTSDTQSFDGLTIETEKIITIQYGQEVTLRVAANATFENTTIHIQSGNWSLQKLLKALAPVRTAEYRNPEQDIFLFDEFPKDQQNSGTQDSYLWDGIEFLKAPGNNSYWVKYDHPTDIYAPGLVNLGYTFHGLTKIHHHIARSAIENAKFQSSFATIAGMLGPLIGGLLIIPELCSKVVAGVIAVIGALCSLFGYLARWGIENFIETELHDGWCWSWGFTQLNLLCVHLTWWFMSFGALRDYPLFVLLVS